ncbi:MAG: LuxR C-terminal-related transcriptional regulator [Bacteroides sp.]|nr:LuxR C-terminal-related transcriptional regulator [Bacteroides sp.]
MNEVAEQLFLTVDTIKFHRRKLFEKLAVRSMIEAVVLANSYSLL